ncbi:DEAD/DEAH box helicase family protein [Sphingomonas lacusdianchii]|uniref:DEAD/DEAH box helicase family protein n=1 Tax=Sphingomonas lacusdianchii TaxID=2917992 RepID=UPI001F5AB864|nr:DEAD/DEAH box helicase family protein [Sphingomonas sp. JXJ CY 53]
MEIDFGALLDDSEAAPINPREIFQTLDKDKAFDFLRDVQRDVLDGWFARRTEKDTVIKLNVGAGKTTVGLLALQSCLNEGVFPAVFVCADRMLVEQVVHEAGRLGIGVTTEPKDPDVRSGSKILVTNIYRVFNGLSVFGVAKAGEKIAIGAIVIDDAHACLRTLERQFRLTIPNGHPVYEWAVARFEDAIKQQSPRSFHRIKAGDHADYVEVPFWAVREASSDLLEQLTKHESEDAFKYVVPFIGEALALCRVIIGGTEMEVSATYPWTDLVNSFRRARRRVYMTATLSDDTILATHFGADPDVLKAAVTTPSATMGERMILMPQQLNSEITLADVKGMLKDFSKQHNVVVIVPSKQASEEWIEVADQILIGDDVAEGVARLRSSHVGLTILINRYDGIDLPEGACRVLAIVGLPEAASLVERADMTVLNASGVTLHRQVQRIEQGMGRGVRSVEDHCAVVLFGSALTERLLSAEGKAMLTSATAVQLELSLRLAKQIEKAAAGTIDVSTVATVIDRCLDRNNEWRKSARTALLKAEGSDVLRFDRTQVALKTAVDQARDGDSRLAARTLQPVVSSAQDGDTRAWLLNRLAHITDFHDRAEAQRTLKAAYNLNRSVVRPIEGINYERISTQSEAQAASSARFLKLRGMELADRVVFATDLTEDLAFKRVSYRKFEAAIRDLGLAIGVLSQRPEEDYHEGPDNLWRLPGREYLVIECKNESEAEGGIAKGDLGQLGQSMEWFQQRYGATEPVIPVVIHPLSHVGPTATAIPGCRVIDGHRLRLLRQSFLDFVKATSEEVISDPAALHEQLATHGLTGERFVETFTTALR